MPAASDPTMSNVPLWDPVDTRPRRVRMRGVVIAAAAVAGATFALHWRDPHHDGSWGKCPSLYLFGIACPLCGGLRAVNDLTNGRIGEAFWSNALFVTVIPLIALWWLSAVLDRWRGSRREWNWPLEVRGVIPAILVIALAFAVFRNVPWGARFYP